MFLSIVACWKTNLIDFSTVSSKKGAVARASEDFMPREPTFQTLHIASVAFNSLLLGEIVVPDWDMFHVRCLLTSDFELTDLKHDSLPLLVTLELT